MRGRRPRPLLVLAAAALLVPGTLAVGQYALDANLRVGSGGYNRPTRGAALKQTRYQPGRTKSVYTVTGDGRMVYNQNNAFNPNSRYTATGYSGTSKYSNGWSRRVRY